MVHRADGRIRDRDSVGAAKIDLAKRGSSKTLTDTTRKPRVDKRPTATSGRTPTTSRAPRTDGPRTTLRLSNRLAETADRLAEELEVSRNDAVLRLAARGARLYEQERKVAELRDRRWAAVVPGIVDIDQAGFPSPDEARAVILEARGEAAAEPAS